MDGSGKGREVDGSGDCSGERDCRAVDLGSVCPIVIDESENIELNDTQLSHTDF